MKNLCRWLRVNKISLNTGKTELLIFRHPNKIINYEFKIKLNRKKLYPSSFVKYSGIYIDSHINFNIMGLWCSIYIYIYIYQFHL